MDHSQHFDTTSFLTKGSQVEVSSDEDGFNGAWFVATVIQSPPSVSTGKKNKYTRNNLVYVEYHNLLSEDGSSRRLREYANVSYVRPSPHPDTNAAAPQFQLNDLVDAFYRDGWWTGVITAVVDNSNFLVTFQNPPDQIQFHSSDLRVHRKWDGGRWVQPEKERTAGLMFTVGKKVEVSFEGEHLRDVWFPATVLKNMGNSSFLVEYQKPGIGDEAIHDQVTVDYLHIRPSPPHLRDKNFVLLEKVDAYYDFGWWNGVVTKELDDNRYNVFFKHTKKEREFVCSRVRPHMEWKGGKWFTTSQAETDGRSSNSQIGQITPTTAVATSVTKSTKETDVDSNDKSLKNEISLSSKQPVGQSEGFDSEVSVTNDQAFGKTENLSHGKKVRSKQGKGVELKTPTMDSERNKGILIASDEGTEKDGENVVVGLQCNGTKLEQVLSETHPNVAQQPLTVVDKSGAESNPPKRKRGRPPKLQAVVTPETPPVAVNDSKKGGEGANVVKEDNAPKLKNTSSEVEGKKYSSMKGKRGKRRTISINAESPAEEKAEEKNSSTRSPEACEDQPLSRWLMPSAATEGSMEQSSVITVGENKLPFIISTPSLWLTIESLEAFRKIPQKPHFRPLESVKESGREGLAIGCMVTFSTVVDKTCALRFEDPRSAIEDCLETLVDLESHGFDVVLIRERLTRMLVIKDHQEELEQRSKGITHKLEERKTERNRMEQEIDEISRKIMELEETRRQLVLAKEKYESEMGDTKAAAGGIHQQLTQLGLDFDGLAAAPFPNQ